MKRKFPILAVLLLSTFCLFTQVSFSEAGSLSSSQVSSFKRAKAAGKLVEQGNGYLTPGSGASGSLVSLMGQVNRLRKEKYKAIAKKTGVPLGAVEMSAGKKLTGR